MTLLRPLLVCFSLLFFGTGVVYPLLVTGLARVLFPWKAQGSLFVVDGRVRGSLLIAQATQDPRYFWSRPSLTATYETNAAASAGSTLAASNPDFPVAIGRRVSALTASDTDQHEPIPADLVTASASGLDPHISLAAARWQVPRIARLRSVPAGELLAFVEAHRSRSLGGDVVAVLELNLALDARRR